MRERERERGAGIVGERRSEGGGGRERERRAGIWWNTKCGTTSLPKCHVANYGPPKCYFVMTDGCNFRSALYFKSAIKGMAWFTEQSTEYKKNPCYQNKNKKSMLQKRTKRKKERKKDIIRG